MLIKEGFRCIVNKISLAPRKEIVIDHVQEISAQFRIRRGPVSQYV
jgi:hypothetical protein